MFDVARETLICLIASVMVAVPVVVITYTKYFRTKKIYPSDVVILHQVPRGPWAPSLSPFPLKLETYLRMTNIPYQNDFCSPFSSKGKTPWMSYNGVNVADSQFCIEFLNVERDIDLNSHLSSEERAVARAFQKMTEENFYWSLCSTMFCQDFSMVYKLLPYSRLRSWLLVRILRRIIRRQMWSHGIGRHSTTDIINIGHQDMIAISCFLGKKKFFMGSKPCEADCTLFGMLAQVKWQMPGSSQEKLLRDELTNLSEYCERMKETFWPDWEDCITHGTNLTANK